jgi:DNA-directed RNA polymerase subunit M/transcription elongation factor TFIIS
MAATRLTCPECNATLKPAQPVPDGKKVKCPKCGVPFISPGAVAPEVFELSEEDAAPAAPSAKRKAPTEAPGKGKKRVPAKGAAKKAAPAAK